jgi:hypothetical protein
MDKEHKQMKEIMGNMDILPAPEGFTGKVMDRVLAEPVHKGTTYQPLISPVVWFVILASFITIAVLTYYFSGNAGETGTFYGIHISLEPVFTWLREVFVSIGSVHVSPVLIYLSVLMLLFLLLADEFILKRIYQRR